MYAHPRRSGAALGACLGVGSHLSVNGKSKRICRGRRREGAVWSLGAEPHVTSQLTRITASPNPEKLPHFSYFPDVNLSIHLKNPNVLKELLYRTSTRRCLGLGHFGFLRRKLEQSFLGTRDPKLATTVAVMFDLCCMIWRRRGCLSRCPSVRPAPRPSAKRFTETSALLS